MKPTLRLAGLAAFVAAGLPLPAQAETLHIALSGYQEVPAISSSGSGDFRAFIDRQAGVIRYELSYRDTGSAVTQAHIHLGQTGVNGGVMVFLCTNLGNSATAPACPAAQGVVTGSISASDVIGPGGQGVDAGEFDELLDAIRSGVTYVNVHTTTYPGGELRGQSR